MPDRRADLCRPGQRMFGTRYYYAAMRGIGGRRLRAALLASSALALAWTLQVTPSCAQDATWLASPGSNVYSTGSNWDTGTRPIGTAYFGASDTTSLSFSFFGGGGTVGGWTFNAGAADYTFTTTNNTSLTFTGAGIVINGGSSTITNNHWLTFYNTSTAGGATINNTGLGLLQFADSSSAGSAVINNAGSVEFYNTSTAGSATIANTGTLNFYANSSAGNTTIANQNLTYFNGYSTAGNATITNNGGISFQNFTTAGNATITNNGGLTFRDNSTAGSAAIINTGSVDFSITTGLNGDNKISAGSIAGAGNYILGANELTVGSNNLSTEVSGVISGSGSLVKIGTGTLILTGANTYTGGTTINGFGSEVWLGNTTGGVGSILGAVTVGSGSLFKIVDADTSGITAITNNGFTNFYNTSTAGSATITNNHTLFFSNSSSAGNATITNNAHLNFYGSAGNAAIANNYMLTFNNTATASSATITSSNASSAIFMYFYDNSTAGSATITNGNNSYLNFFGNSTAGSASFTNNSYMYFKDASTVGNATIDNTNGTTFFYNNSTAGNATITNNAGGTTYFYENSTAGNARLINSAANAVFDFSYGTGPNGDNKLSAGSIAGDGTFSLGANALMVGSNNLSTTVSGVIADGGANGGVGAWLVKTGTGTLTLTGTNTYSGGTTFSGGTVSVSSDANLGDAAGGLTFNGGAFRVTGTAFTSTARTVTLGAGGGTFDVANAANTFALSQVLTGTGGLNKTGAGTLTLSGINTYTGATTVSAGTLIIEGSVASSTITNNGTLNFNHTSTAGNAAIANNSDQVFRDSSSAGGATITNHGLLSFYDTSTAGGAALINHAGGTVDFSNSTGPNGDGKLSAGSIAGAGSYVLGGNELTVGSNNLSTEVVGVISGSGSLVKAGTGTLTLSGGNTYTGATTVNGSTLAVNSSLTATSGITVNSGGALGGTGTVGSTTVNAGGALAPGNSIGTLTVSGHLAFTTGSFYTVEVSPTSADRTNVTGTATLTGATVQAVALGPARFRAETYTLLNASGGFGGTQFAGLDVINSFRPGARNPHLTYDANNVYLVLDPGEIILPSGTNANQASVAGGINRAVLGGATPPAAFDVLLNLDGTPLKNALTQISGETATGAQQSTFNAVTMFMGAMTDPFIDGRNDIGASVQAVSSYAADGAARRAAVARDAFAAIAPAGPTNFEQRWNVWAAGFGGSQATDGNTAQGSNGTTGRLFGTAAGADYRFSAHTLAGFALAGGGTNFSVAGGGTGRSDLFQAGAFVRHHNGPAYVSAALAYGWQDVTTDRTVTVAGIDRLQARFQANTFAGRVEGGYRFATPWMAVTPYAAGQVTTLQLPAYAESVLSGANTFALSYDAKTVTASRSELGLRTDRSWVVGDAILTLRGRAAWAHDFNPDRAAAAAFQTLPGASFVVNGAAQARDAALATAAAEMKWCNGFSLGASFEGEFSSVTSSYAGKGMVRYAW